MTFVWFILWLIFDIIGDEEPLTFDPVNFWAGALLFAIAVDLAGIHTRQPAEVELAAKLGVAPRVERADEVPEPVLELHAAPDREAVAHERDAEVLERALEDATAAFPGSTRSGSS